MSEVNLSKAVRSNLLSLQNTAQMMAKTQTRLATGLKVNSALDNPTNFFTAAALNSRAGDMANLLDSMSSGIKTIEAADNGLTSIVKTVETMQSSLRQARQDKSFKSASYTIDAAAIGTTAAKNLTFSGGAVGTTPIDIQLNTLASTATASTITGTGANFATNFTGGTITVNGQNVTIRGDQAATSATLSGTGGTDLTADPDLSALNGESITINDGTNSVTYSFTNSAAGQKAAMLTALNASGYNVTGTASGLSITRADGSNFTVTTSSPAVAAAVGITGGTASTNGVPAFDATAATVAQDFNNAGISGLTGSVVSGQVALSLASGANLTLGGSDTLLTSIGFAAGNRASTDGVPSSTAEVKTVDALVSEINTTLSGKIRASNDNGKLRIENLSTTDLSVVGVNGTSGKVDGALGPSNTTSVGRNDVRKNLVQQFNDLRDQLDKFSDDASFNGINLLRGDKLKLTFNETGTSTIEIQAKTVTGVATAINNTSLSIDYAVDADFDNDATLDARLDKLAGALGFLRSLASSFGSNLSIVENRTNFTKKMINTLETGAANLTLADTNEEAANLLALQTRQQLSSTALSMASQADQAVLRLFG